MSKQLYRDPVNAKLGGVCAGIANYFNIEHWVVRVLVVSMALFSGFFMVILAYVAMVFLIDKQDMAQAQHQQQNQVHQVKSKPWAAGESVTSILTSITNDLDKMEKRIQTMEAHVTSDSYKVNKEFQSL